jgi:Fe-S-cluster containining protein
MALDFSEYFDRYDAVLAKVDQAFAQVKEQTGDAVTCGQGCSDCCYALFDLTLVEAMYISHHFRKTFSGMQRSEIMERADNADREVNRMKRKLYKASEKGAPTDEILRLVAETRLRCPLLGEGDLCQLYDHRPLTCRAYGVPTAIGDSVHTCGQSGFEPGKPYPTIRIETLQDSLLSMSMELTGKINTRYKELGTMLLPLSMAILTEFDEDFLGIMEPGEKPAEPVDQPLQMQPADCSSCSEEQGSSACSSCKDTSFTMTLKGHEKDED